MEKEFFSLLWDREEYYEEWVQSKDDRDREYIIDLNLEYLYEEVRRIGGFGDHYDFRDVFLYSCRESSTVEYRHKIIDRIYRDPRLYDTAVRTVSCVSDTQKRLAQVCGIRDELKKKIFFLQVLYEFFVRLGEIYLSLREQLASSAEIYFRIAKMAEDIAGQEGEEKRKRLYQYLSMLDGITPERIVLNKDGNQTCRSAVVWQEEEGAGYTDRLKAAASFFLGDYDYSIRVYQDMDITCFDKKIQEYLCRRQPNFVQDTERLYRDCKDFDFWPFIKAANELVFYLSAVRFRKRYEQEGFVFTMPKCLDGAQTRVAGAYDMVLGVNLFREGGGRQAVPNDFCFDPKGRFFILTGANQGGKTTFIRSVGLVQHLAQVGLFVPAREAVLGMVKNIHTHFSRADEEGALAGRFEQELKRMRKLLGSLEEGDMVLLNESFTSTRRLGAVALLRWLLSEFDRRLCVGGLVTHYHEIFDGLEEGSFYSLTAEVAQYGDRVDRTFQIRKAASYRQSYARDIAEKCGATYEQLVQAFVSAGEEGEGDVRF